MQKCRGIFSQLRNYQEDSLHIMWLSRAVPEVSPGRHSPAVLHQSLLWWMQSSPSREVWAVKVQEEDGLEQVWSPASAGWNVDCILAVFHWDPRSNDPITLLLWQNPILLLPHLRRNGSREDKAASVPSVLHWWLLLSLQSLVCPNLHSEPELPKREGF